MLLNWVWRPREMPPLAMSSEGIVLQKVLGQEGHDNFMPKSAWHTWEHIVAWEVEGPSGDPLTQQQ